MGQNLVQRGRLVPGSTFVLLVTLAMGCGQTGSAARISDAGDEGSHEGDDSGTDASEGQPDANAGGASGPFACGGDAASCAPGQVCLDQVFINGLPTPSGAPATNPESDTYSCVASPCDASTSDFCNCGICSGAQCSAAGAQVTCTTESVCASAETPIATADGDRPIASLRPGDMVYSADHGALRLVALLEVARTAVFHHRVIELRLSNGSLLMMSAGHPLADGRLLGNLEAGDALEGATVVERSEIPYAEPFTYDILPASDSHTYVAAGVLVGTTLRHP